MNILKKIFNLLGILLAFVISVVLVAVLITVPVFSGATSFAKTENLKKLVSEIDFSEFVIAEENEAENEIIINFMETDLMADLIGLYVEDVFAALEGNTESKNLTEDSLKATVDEHMDELIPIMKELMAEELSAGSEIPAGTNIQIADEDIAKMIQQMLDEDTEMILESFPSIEDLGIDENVIMILTYLREGVFLYVIIGVAAVLSLLILICRCVRFKGFMWLGVVYIISAIIMFLAAFGFNNSGAAVLAATVPYNEAVVVAEPILSMLAKELKESAGITAVLAVVFIIIFALGRKVTNKKLQNNE